MDDMDFLYDTEKIAFLQIAVSELTLKSNK